MQFPREIRGRSSLELQVTVHTPCGTYDVVKLDCYVRPDQCLEVRTYRQLSSSAPIEICVLLSDASPGRISVTKIVESRFSLTFISHPDIHLARKICLEDQNRHERDRHDDREWTSLEGDDLGNRACQQLYPPGEISNTYLRPDPNRERLIRLYAEF